MRQNKSDMYTSTGCVYINDIHLHISCLMDQNKPWKTSLKITMTLYKLFWWFTNTSERDNNFCCLKTAFQDLCFVQDDLLWAKPQGEKMEIQQKLRDFVGSSRLMTKRYQQVHYKMHCVCTCIYYNICHMYVYICIQKTGMCFIYIHYPFKSHPDAWTHRRLPKCVKETHSWGCFGLRLPERLGIVTPKIVKHLWHFVCRVWWGSKGGILPGESLANFDKHAYTLYSRTPSFWDYSSQGGYSMPTRLWSSNTVLMHAHGFLNFSIKTGSIFNHL